MARRVINQLGGAFQAEGNSVTQLYALLELSNEASLVNSLVKFLVAEGSVLKNDGSGIRRGFGLVGNQLMDAAFGNGLLGVVPGLEVLPLGWGE